MSLQQSQHGYATTRPMHREARHMMMDRDKREKTRIGGQGPTSTNPLVEQPISAGYSNNADRFSKDVGKQLSGEEKHRKDHHAEVVRHKQDRNMQRQQARWSKLEAEDAKAKADAKAVAGTGMRNKGSVGYNLLNGSWGSSEDAARAKYRDDCVEYSAKQRSLNLDTRGNSNEFNIISGQKRTTVVVPSVPEYHPPAPTPPGSAANSTQRSGNY